MALWFAALLGLVQGLTEFIPVSSNAHLRMTYALFRQSDETGAPYTAVIQLGSTIAVLAYFGKDLLALAQAVFKDPGGHDARLVWMIGLGTVPIVILGVLLKSYVEDDLRSLYIVASALIGVGLVMAYIDQTASTERDLTTLTYRDAILIGLAQTLALCPGVSRSGATICMALLLGFARSDAARFSFLLSIPAVAGAGIFEARTAVHKLGDDALPAIAIGILVAAITSYFAIAWLIKWLGSHQLVGFAIYRVVIGIAVFASLAAGWIEAS
jgi:undecaprenyl-diphosphatase|nr:undecaprenyl-diphosphatase UppP [Kofleriaceae bacterium]